MSGEAQSYSTERIINDVMNWAAYYGSIAFLRKLDHEEEGSQFLCDILSKKRDEYLDCVPDDLYKDACRRVRAESVAAVDSLQEDA